MLKERRGTRGCHEFAGAWFSVGAASSLLHLRAGWGQATHGLGSELRKGRSGSTPQFLCQGVDDEPGSGLQRAFLEPLPGIRPYKSAQHPALRGAADEAEIQGAPRTRTGLTWLPQRAQRTRSACRVGSAAQSYFCSVEKDKGQSDASPPAHRSFKALVPPALQLVPG